MNNLLIDVLPVLLFFVVFKYYGIYTATVTGMVATALQVLGCRYYYQRWEKMQLFTLVIFLLFGSMTLYFHNPIFVKWKPTIIFWSLAIIVLTSYLLSDKPLMNLLLENALANHKINVKPELPKNITKLLNFGWAVFFITIGAINLYVAYNYSDAIWINFKLYGITGATLLVSISQTWYLLRYFNA
jgi:intracellular septation protein